MIIYTVVTLSVLGLLLALVLFLIARKFKVEEDPRIDQIEAIMPGANCGGCGFAGCRAFSENVVKATSLDGFFCPVGGNEVMKKVAATMGYAVEENVPKIAVVRCNGTCEARPKTSVYDGISSCKVIKTLYQGDTGCKYGCFGQGDCVEACVFNALKMNTETGLPEVNEDNCVACGACVKACPQGIIELRNKGMKNRRVYVACMNQDKGGVARKACANACIGCKKCEQVCPFDAIKVENFLSYIDYDKCRLCRKCVDVCPTGAILTDNFPLKKKLEINHAEVNPIGVNHAEVKSIAIKQESKKMEA
ncbi:MAG: RnfABCDGE type electron transport complex subunit B [Bacteroidales bacterium]